MTKGTRTVLILWLLIALGDLAFKHTHWLWIILTLVTGWYLSKIKDMIDQR